MEAKVVYNSKYGGFSLSDKAIKRLTELGYQFKEKKYPQYEDIPRHNPLLIQTVEELKEEASGECCNLKIEKICSLLYKIENYDGKENVIKCYDDWIIAI